MLNLVIISGSAREERKTHAVAKTLKQKIDQLENVQAHLLDVKEYNFPLLNYTFRAHPDPSEGMKDFHEKLEQADAMLVVSPEYNNSFSGPIKNTMDYFYPEYKHMAAGIVTVSAGGTGGINAAKHLQHFVMTLQAIPLPKILTTPKVNDLYDGDTLNSEDYEKKVDSFLEEFMRFAQAIKSFKNSSQS